MAWSAPNKGKTSTGGKNVNTSNRPTMGTSFLQGFVATPPLRGTLRPRGSAKFDIIGGGTATHRQGKLERLGPGYRIVPSVKAADPSGLSAATQGNGRIITSALGNRDQFYAPTSVGRPERGASGTWSPPNKGKTSAR